LPWFMSTRAAIRLLVFTFAQNPLLCQVIQRKTHSNAGHKRNLIERAARAPPSPLLQRSAQEHTVQGSWSRDVPSPRHLLFEARPRTASIPKPKWAAPIAGQPEPDEGRQALRESWVQVLPQTREWWVDRF